MSEIIEEENSEIMDKISGKVGNKCLVIGCGQGGSRLGNAISLKFKSTDSNIYINTSSKDIKGLNIKDMNRIVKLGGEEIEGAGKDRSAGNQLLSQFRDSIINKVKEKLTEEFYDYVFVTFTTSGGTGGGIGPKVTALINSDVILKEVEKKFGKIPLVFGVAAIPEICAEEGNISYKNTLLCLNDIKKFVTNDVGRYIIVHNGFDMINTRKQERTSKLDMVNVSVANVIHRYFTEYGTSRISNLDRADRHGALSTMGLHSWMVLDTNGERSDKYNPFVIPDGERVKRVCYEVPETMVKIVSKQIEQTGIISDDQIHGLYDLEDESNKGLLPVIGFHGFKNVDKICEQYEKRIKLNEENARRIEKGNVLSSTGLENIKEIDEETKNEYGHHGAKSLDDIFD